MKFLHLFKKPIHFNDLKLKYKLGLIIAVITSIISMFTAITFWYTIEQYNELLYSQTGNSLSFFSDEVTYQLESIVAISSYISFDAAFQENLSEMNTAPPSSLRSQKSMTTITSILNRYYTYNMVQITVLSDNQTSIWWGQTPLKESQKFMDTLYQSCDEADGRLVWSFSENGSGILCARKILKAKNLSLKPLGYLIIQIDIDNMMQSLVKYRYSNGQKFQIFLSTKDQLIYPHKQINNEQTFKPLSSDSKSYIIDKVMGNRMFITFTKLPLDNVDWNISLAVPYGEIFHSLKRIVPVFIASLLGAIFISVVLSGHIVKNISYQFHTLVGKMNGIKLEGINYPIDFAVVKTTSQDELTVLNAYFDHMVVQLKKLIDENYVKELLITQAELKALEQQVNPHFLYNTLNSINWLAKKADIKEISIIAQSLGTMLQNTLSNGKTMITLEYELDIVSCYIKIQQIRFNDLVVITNIDPSILQTDIPKMTIQPLIENAILYAQEELQDQYTILLFVKQEGSFIHIRIENSGSKIDKDILSHIKNNKVKPKGNGIGLLNIDTRLRLIFGDISQLNFDNIDEMAVVYFKIPLFFQNYNYTRKEDSHV